MLMFFLGVVACIAISYFFPKQYKAALAHMGSAINDVAQSDREGR